MRMNIPPAKSRPKTHEGGPADRMNLKDTLRRSVLSCLLWEQTFYEAGQDIAERIADLTQQVARKDPDFVRNLALDARSKYNLRHCPLWMLVAMSKVPGSLTKEIVAAVLRRADEPAELLSMYWAEGKKPVANAIKRGIALAFPKWDAYQLAKHDRLGAVKMRDALFISHAKPKDEKQAEIWRDLIEGKLPPPDTWEVELSAGKDKKATFTRLIQEGRLGYMALLRNLRNMQQAGVEKTRVAQALTTGKGRSRVLSFRFVAAARACPSWEDIVEHAMLDALKEHPKLPGSTLLLVDVSGSMEDRLSRKSDLTRMDAAAALGIILRDICEDVRITTFSGELLEVPPRHGFALADAIVQSQDHDGTYLGAAIDRARDKGFGCHRLVIITDEQAHDNVGMMEGWDRKYLINVAPYKNGISYHGNATHIDGFSEAVVRYILEKEQSEND